MRQRRTARDVWTPHRAARGDAQPVRRIDNGDVEPGPGLRRDDARELPSTQQGVDNARPRPASTGPERRFQDRMRDEPMTTIESRVAAIASNVAPILNEHHAF